MKNTRQLATILGGLTVLTAALFAQNQPPASSAPAPGAANTPVNPSNAPVVPPVALPDKPADPAKPVDPMTPPMDPSPVAQPGPAMTSTGTPLVPPAAPAPGTVTPGGVHPMVFANLDTDGDGKISSAEYDAYVSKMNAAPGGAAAPTPAPVKQGFWDSLFHHNKPVPAPTSATTGANANPSFADLDTNHDGYLSQAEIDAQGSLKK